MRNAIDRYLEDTLDAFEDDRFDIDEDVRWEGIKFRAVAESCKRTGLFGESEHETSVVFKKFETLSRDKLLDFAGDAREFVLANRLSRGRLGRTALVYIVPVALVGRANDRVVDFLCDEHVPNFDLGWIEYPVIYEADADEIYWCEWRSPKPDVARALRTLQTLLRRYLDPRA
jgi:hypothetical protein